MGAAKRAEVEHDKHLATLDSVINHHKDACDKCHADIVSIQIKLDGRSELAHSFEKRCVRLEERCWAAGWMNIFGNVMVASGGGLLSLAGCLPNIEDWAKYVMGGFGAANCICGLIFVVLSYRTANRQNQELEKSTHS